MKGERQGSDRWTVINLALVLVIKHFQVNPTNMYNMVHKFQCIKYVHLYTKCINFTFCIEGNT